MAFFQRIGTCTGFLLRHKLPELTGIHSDPLLCGDLSCQFDGETIRIMQGKCIAAGNDRPPAAFLLSGAFRLRILLRFADGGIKDNRPLVQGTPESSFLTVRSFTDRIKIGIQLGIAQPHLFLGYGKEMRQDFLLYAEHFHCADTASEKAPQDISAPFIARPHTIAHNHQC